MARRSDHSQDALRLLILDAAEAVLAAEGLSGLTAREIARRIGYSPGTIYNFFQNLDDVVLHVEARLLDRLHARLSSIPEPRETRPPLGKQPPLGKVRAREKLHRLASAYLTFTHDNPRLWGVLFEHYLPPGVAAPDWYLVKLQRLLAIVEEALAPYFAPQERDRAREAARVLWAGVHGIISLSLADKLAIVTSASAGSLVENLLTNYLAGLETRSAQPDTSAETPDDQPL